MGKLYDDQIVVHADATGNLQTVAWRGEDYAVQRMLGTWPFGGPADGQLCRVRAISAHGQINVLELLRRADGWRLIRCW